MAQERVRPSRLAGSWYPADPTTLRNDIESYIAAAENVTTASHLYAVIAPHAGYAFSGPCAGWSFAQLRKRDIQRVFLLAPAHTARFRGVSIPPFDAYATPLGQVPIARDVCDTLSAHPLITSVPHAHAREHSIEIMLPFLQVAAPDATLVPLLVSAIDANDARELGALLATHLQPHDIIVASGDFTHYGRSFNYVPFSENIQDNLKELDMGLVHHIKNTDVEGIFTYEQETGITCCGTRPFAITVAALPADAQAQLLEYYTSGEKEGNFQHSVSYVALAFSGEKGFSGQDSKAAQQKEIIEQTEESDAAADADDQEADTAEAALTEEEKAVLLRIARDTLTQYVTDGTKPALDDYPLTPRLKEHAGAFVTLHQNGRLRGCIGFIEGIAPLAVTVQENACNAATRDTRFPQVKPEELDAIDIEISVMSPLRPIDSPEDVIVGTHGVVLVHGRHQGVFLPQVPVEQGWDRRTYLQQLALKAGLPPNAYRHAHLKVFSADIFAEEK